MTDREREAVARKTFCACGHSSAQHCGFRGVCRDSRCCCMGFKAKDATIPPVDPDALGRLVIATWVSYQDELAAQGYRAWNVPAWDHMDEKDRELARRIGEAVARAVREGNV